ncbi:YHYH domain-containing protein [Cohnella ginsengisoli]|uniref:YHYH domain-containing protein n=1 Tax=Cohnella ginsengisoli TaxID=425004 RepID=A0A9X4KG02_9BACL|nr:YHYH domain-containing protein [Cohnella ginsengisoli]MDG0791438.1 YHYH domain-containing protein [Cohnella ginsengisoli]
MKKILVFLIAVVVLIGTSSSAYAHSGRTDKNGGHNCSAKSKQKGLCTGYHYHNKKR